MPGVIANATDLLNLPIRSNANSTVTLSDVAQVRRTFYDPTTFAEVNGQPTISLDVSKRIGSNIIANNQAVRAIVDKAAKTWPAGVHVTYLFDNSTDIRDMLGSLSDSILLAIVLVMIIVGGGARPALGPPGRHRDPDLLPDGVHDPERRRLHAEHDDHVRHAAGGRHPGGRRDHRGRIRRPQDDRGAQAAPGLRRGGAAHVLAGG